MAPLLRVGTEVDHEGPLLRPHRLEVAGDPLGFGDRQAAPSEDAMILPGRRQRSRADFRGDLGPVAAPERDVGRAVGRDVNVPIEVQRGIDEVPA